MTKWRLCPSWLMSLIVLVGGAHTVWADDSGDDVPTAMLFLADGDFFAGTLENSDMPNVIHWQSPAAVRPFQFSMTAVRAAFFPPRADRAAAKSDYRFELSDGDLLFGSLVGVDDEKLVIDSPRFGHLHVLRSDVTRLTPWQGSAAWEYSGPNGLAEWEHRPAKDGWREEAGHLLTEKHGALLRKEVKIPPQACIELAISWNGASKFMFGISAGTDEKREGEGFHIEVWNDTLVVVRVLEDDADVAPIGDLKDLKNRVHLLALLDQEKGTLSVHSLDGLKLAEIVVQGDYAPLRWLSLRNLNGHVRLEQLVVSHWNGQLPPQIDVDKPRIHQADGTISYGNVIRYDAESREFVIEDGSQETTVRADEIASVVLTPAAEPAASPVRIGCHDGTRLGGETTKVESGSVHITRSGVDESLAFPVADVRFLIGMRRETQKPASQKAVGRLEIEGLRSHGALVDGKSNEETGCLIWQPIQSATSSPLHPNVSGQIVYRDPPPAKKQPTPQPAQRQRGFWGAVVEVFAGQQTVPQPKPKPPATAHLHTLFMLAGDRVPCNITRIDDRGVHFTSSVVQTEFVPHDQIKALELVTHTAAAALDEAKRQRLLTLPRMQKNNPPTHLIASNGGDYLRARLQSMDAESLAVETRLETKRIDRSHVACIIWLHDETQAVSPADGDEQAASSFPVQAVRADGVRLTFVPHESSNNSLVGTSTLLGPCQVDLRAVDRLLFGRMIGEVADEPTYEVWKLHDAVEPRYVRDDEEGSPASAGLASSLVAKPAPDFRLELLEGGHFELSREKGHVVVLDFWASWCAPCMQGLPEVDAVTREFKDKNVKLVAINMQEDRSTIDGALERLQINPAVALDIDGATAEKFEVSAIPQTVVIDAEGNVAWLFIGADPNFAEQLRQTLEELVKQSRPAASDPGAS